MSLSSPETFHAVVRPFGKPWEDRPKSLYFDIQPPIDVADPVGLGDAISNNLYEHPGQVRVTPVLGVSTQTRTKGFMFRGYRPELGDTGLFGITPEVERASVESAIMQLVGTTACHVEFIDIPVEL